jgi:1,4-alpha-glucan branching enzyme
MLRKTPLASGRKVKVTFEIDAPDAATATVAGEFNEWDPVATPMKRRKSDGMFAASLTLESGRRYQFRYVLDGAHWVSDANADGSVGNRFGTDNSIVET